MLFGQLYSARSYFLTSGVCLQDRDCIGNACMGSYVCFLLSCRDVVALLTRDNRCMYMVHVCCVAVVVEDSIF